MIRESTSVAETETVTIQRTFDPASTRVTDELFDALQDVGRAMPSNAPPLTSVLDPDALDHLFPAEPPAVGAAMVTFAYAGATVVVSGEGFVRVEAPVDGSTFSNSGLGIAATSGRALT